MLRDLFSFFPAYAGVILAARNLLFGRCSFPRICGGDPSVPHYNVDICAFSPQRGGDPYAAKPADYIVPFSPHTRG